MILKYDPEKWAAGLVLLQEFFFLFLIDVQRCQQHWHVWEWIENRVCCECRREPRPFYLGWEPDRYDRTRPEGEKGNFQEKVGFEEGSERREQYIDVYHLYIVADGCCCAIQRLRRWVKYKYWTGLVQERSLEALRRCKMCSWRKNGQCGRI